MVAALGLPPRHAAFVGRLAELDYLHERLAEARAGQARLVMVVGEPGIGKTRTVEEFARRAQQEGATVLWGRCHEGEWAPPYGPFAEAIAEYVAGAEPDGLRHDLGYGAAPIARLAPALREKLPDIEEPVALQPDEERFRLLDAVSQFFIATSQRAPVVLVLDDLHWADKGTIAMLRHVARFAKQHRILLVGMYRNVELDREHPLTVALGQLRGDTVLESLPLAGLERNDVVALVSMVAEQALPDELVAAIGRETTGNPFFVHEILLHLVESGAMYKKEGAWQGDTALIQEIGLPGGVREAVQRRLSRLSDNARALLTAACAFDGGFPFAVALATAKLSEEQALDALDQALAAQVLQAGAGPETYEFTHALVRDTLYGDLSPSRQARLHRNVAEALEGFYEGREGAHAAEIAYHYHRSATLPGAERGVEYAITAADREEAMYAHEDAGTFLRIALDLLQENDPRTPRLLGRLAVAETLAGEFESAGQIAGTAAELIAASEGPDAAAEYLADLAILTVDAGFQAGGWMLGAKGLQFTGEKRNVTWARLMVWDLQRQWAEDTEGLGVPVITAEALEVAALLAVLASERSRLFLVSSREEVLTSTHYSDNPVALMGWAGEFRRATAMHTRRAEEYERQGQIGGAVYAWSHASFGHAALGELDSAQEAYGHAKELASRLPPGGSQHSLALIMAQSAINVTTDPDNLAVPALLESLLGSLPGAYQFAFAAIRGAVSVGCAIEGRRDDALRWLESLLQPIERAHGMEAYYALLASEAARTLWLLNATDHAEVFERNLREKVLAPDLRSPTTDARHSLAQLCALQGRHSEAIEWFARAREVLDDQGARPLRAIVDYDEALMYVRRGRRGDRVRALPLVEAALSQFREIGMTGWVRWAESLQRGIDEKTAGVANHPAGMTPREVDVLRLIAAGRTNNEIAADLTLSVRTVARHITHIYEKIGARNKVEATDYANHHGVT